MKLVLAGREYPFPDFSTITFREGSLIKKYTGLKIGQLPEAFEQGDSDGLLAIVIVAKLRQDGDVNLDALLDMSMTDLEVVTDEEEEDSPLDEDAE